jgi:hypothetical protein
MSIEATIALIATIVLTVGGGIASLIWALVARHQKNQDDRAAASEAACKEEVARLEKSYKETRTKMWEKIDHHADEINFLKLALTEIRGNLAAMPNNKSINIMLSDYNGRIEKRIDSLAAQLDDIRSSLMSIKLEK